MASFQLSQDGMMALARAGLHDRIVGCLYGSALGDAIGLYTEFLSGDMSAMSYPCRKFVLSPASQATPFRRDRHRSTHKPGGWTDDTDHAMLILLSCLHRDLKTLDPNDFASRLHMWVQYGLRALDSLPLGLGRTVGAIVRTKNYLDHPEGTARRHWAKTNYNAAPNGSLMRTHPLGLMCLERTVEETFQVAADYSVVTHVDPRCIVSCAIGTALVRGLVRQEVCTETDIDDMVELAIKWYAAYRERELQDPARKDEPELDIADLKRHARVDGLKDLELDDGHKIGYVYKTFGSGIHLLRLAMRETASSGGTLSSQTSLFEALMTDLVMRGGDADTNACFAGALVGAYLGYKALPAHWRDGLQHGAWLMRKAEGLCQLLGVVDGDYRGSADAETAPDGGRGVPTEADMERKVMLLQAWMAKEEQEWKRREEAEEKRKKGGWLKWK
ncbi:Uncharacterized protein TPAR_06129 [Tolypocladium paradoxum]|uniref:ADP-ribosylglycohydrolase n=1 Tax=Tolypocladium paradoxum TaxID=94208 RepID=A0A2S4KU37_9HYPO|nr:Uncharacterized protein TPAR_06129 [Tolypocladium paradoxum]